MCAQHRTDVWRLINVPLWGRCRLPRAVLLQPQFLPGEQISVTESISPTLMQQQLLQLQGLLLSDWVRVPLTFSHFTETVLKRPSQSPDFMAEPSQGPTDLMDITRINQTFMPARSSTAESEAWLRIEQWHDWAAGGTRIALWVYS